MSKCLFNKLAGLRPSVLLKKRLRHSCFLLNFVKLFRTLFLLAQTDEEMKYYQFSGAAVRRCYLK